MARKKRTTILVICRGCGKALNVPPRSHIQTCSVKCAKAVREGKCEVKGHERRCEMCGRIFWHIVTDSKGPKLDSEWSCSDCKVKPTEATDTVTHTRIGSRYSGNRDFRRRPS